MEWEVIINGYFIVAGISTFATGLWILTGDYGIKGVDTFWDFIIYNLFWIVQPIKATIKFFNKTLRDN